MGTPSYMSPEQVDSDGADVNYTSDVYSLGAIFYEMLTGRPPFREATTMGTLMNVLEADAPMPRALNKAVPRDLETICMKCLAKDPERRYATADDLVVDLELYLQNEPIHARRLGVPGRLLRWARHTPLLAITYFGCSSLYGFHLFCRYVIERPGNQGFFHTYLSIALPTFCLAATVAQRLLASDRWKRAGQYGYCTISVLLPSCSFLADPEPSVAPLQVLLVVIPLSALINRSWKLIGYTTGIAVLAYISLVTHSLVHRPSLGIGLEIAIPFVISQFVMGMISYLMVRRARLAGDGLRFDTSSSVSVGRQSAHVTRD